MRYRICRLLSSKLDNPKHEYSFHFSDFNMNCRKKKPQAQMPLSPSKVPKRKSGKAKDIVGGVGGGREGVHVGYQIL